MGPKTQVILKSITRAPTFIQTETRSTLGRTGEKIKNNTLVFNIPGYSSRYYAKYYKDDVISALFSVLAKFPTSAKT